MMSSGTDSERGVYELDPIRQISRIPGMSRLQKIKYQEIKQAAMKMAEAVRPEKIILFGSYAYGRPKPESDVDFLLILGKKKKRKDRRLAFLKASDALTPRPFPVDIIIRSQNDVDASIKDGGDFFLEEILEKGRILYEH
jgi:uncharacterized protein